MYILVANRRYGSSLMQNYIMNANLKQNVVPIAPFEFFNIRQYDFNIGNFTSIESKINFLENKRKRGYEYSHKVLAEDIDNLEIKNWFDEFYKDWEKIILHRKDKWNPFLSRVVQTNINNDNTYWDQETAHETQDIPNVEKKIICKLKPFYISREDVVLFWKYEDLLNEWDGIKLYLEDFMPDVHKSLCKYFNVNILKTHNKINLDYEKYILNLTQAKDWFNRYGI